MVTLVGTQSDFFYALKELAELLHELTETMTAASNRLEDDKYKKIVDEIMNRNKKYVGLINKFLEEKGKETAKGPSGAQLLSIGRVAIAQIMGDKSIFHTLIKVMGDVETAYSRIHERSEEADSIRELLSKGLEETRNSIRELKENS